MTDQELRELYRSAKGWSTDGVLCTLCGVSFFTSIKDENRCKHCRGKYVNVEERAKLRDVLIEKLKAEVIEKQRKLEARIEARGKAFLDTTKLPEFDDLVLPWLRLHYSELEPALFDEAVAFIISGARSAGYDVGHMDGKKTFPFWKYR